ncbi:MAG: amino acid ABC transporter permease [Candidatus Accumulibacter sp.]|jgi:polar amino acid transport system permease protein|nr:amino acid ABC transporter permease [Accumulibacter sp.]
MPFSGADILLDSANLARLAEGLIVTVRVAAVSIVFAFVLGMLIGVIALSRGKLVQIPYQIFLQSIRIVPQLVWLFLFFFGFAKWLGWNWNGETTGIVVFSIWGTAEMADIVRASIGSLPVHQTQSAAALGLSRSQIYLFVLIPQAVRRLLPVSINLATRIIKTTPLLVLITVVEVLKVGQQLIEVNILTNSLAAFWVYGLIFVIYFLICFPVALLSRKLEARWSVQ